VGIRLSPFGVLGDLPLYPEMEADYGYLARALNAAGLFYVHLVDPSAMGAPAVPQSIKDTFRKEFKGVLILSGGYDAARGKRSRSRQGRSDRGRPGASRQSGSGRTLEDWRSAQSTGYGHVLYAGRQGLYRLSGIGDGAGLIRRLNIFAKKARR